MSMAITLLQEMVAFLDMPCTCSFSSVVVLSKNVVAVSPAIIQESEFGVGPYTQCVYRSTHEKSCPALCWYIPGIFETHCYTLHMVYKQGRQLLQKASIPRNNP